MAKKADSAPQLQSLTVERKAKRADDYVVLYSNDTQVQTTPWDIRLIFGRIESAPTEGDLSLIVNQVGEVSMSLQHAKRVAAILHDQITQYEKKVGPIVIAGEE